MRWNDSEKNEKTKESERKTRLERQEDVRRSTLRERGIGFGVACDEGGHRSRTVKKEKRGKIKSVGERRTGNEAGGTKGVRRRGRRRARASKR